MTPRPKATNGTKIVSTLGELVRARAALGRLLELPLPIKLAYTLAKLGKFVEAELKLWEERRVALAKSLGEEREPTEAERENGAATMFKIKPENMAKWREEIGKLNEIEVTLDWKPFSLADLPDGKIAAADILDLGALISVDEPKDATR